MDNDEDEDYDDEDYDNEDELQIVYDDDLIELGFLDEDEDDEEDAE